MDTSPHSPSTGTSLLDAAGNVGHLDSFSFANIISLLPPPYNLDGTHGKWILRPSHPCPIEMCRKYQSRNCHSLTDIQTSMQTDTKQFLPRRKPIQMCEKFYPYCRCKRSRCTRLGQYTPAVQDRPVTLLPLRSDVWRANTASLPPTKVRRLSH